MLDYIKSILPRIQQYSKKLDDTAAFVDIPWGFIDKYGRVVTYIFRRNNELLVSTEGDVETGKWEYLPNIQSLLIEHNQSKELFNQGFLDKAVMVLKKDGTNQIIALGNNHIIHHHDISKYLETKIAKIEYRERLRKIQSDPKTSLIATKDKSQRLYFKSKRRGIPLPGSTVYNLSDGQPVESGDYTLANGKKINVVDGKVNIVHHKRNYLVEIILLILIGVILYFIFLHDLK